MAFSSDRERLERTVREAINNNTIETERISVNETRITNGRGGGIVLTPEGITVYQEDGNERTLSAGSIGGAITPGRLSANTITANDLRGQFHTNPYIHIPPRTTTENYIHFNRDYEGSPRIVSNGNSWWNPAPRDTVSGNDLNHFMFDEYVNVPEEIKDDVITQEEDIKMTKEVEQTFRISDILDNYKIKNMVTFMSRFKIYYSVITTYIQKHEFGDEYEVTFFVVFNTNLQIKNILFHQFKKISDSYYKFMIDKHNVKNETNYITLQNGYNKEFLEIEYEDNDLLISIRTDSTEKESKLINGYIQHEYTSTLFVEKDLLKRKMMEWERKELTLGEEYEVQRYVSFLFEKYSDYKINFEENLKPNEPVHDLSRNTKRNMKRQIENQPYSLNFVESIRIALKDALFGNPRDYNILPVHSLKIIEEYKNYYIVKAKSYILSASSEDMKIHSDYYKELDKYTYFPIKEKEAFNIDELLPIVNEVEGD